MERDALYQDVYEKYMNFINPNLAKLMGFGGFGVEMRAEGCYIFDHEGRQFLDCLGGYGTFSFGHRHPRIIDAVKRQLDIMPLSGKAFFGQNAANLAAKLAELTPGDLKVSFFCNSGTEAVEACLKLAKGATGRVKIVSTEGSYHGKTLGALAATGRAKYRKKFEPLMPGVEFVPYGDVEALVNAVEACDKHGALLIFDEVQTGMGRTGYRFGCNHDGVAPDLMSLAKAIGGGVMPLGVAVYTEDVYNKVFGENPLAHTSTFGGNPLACAAGLEALAVLEEEGLAERSRILGERMLAGFRKIQAKFPELLADVRGRGLMIGAEFSMDEVGEVVVATLMKHRVCVAYTLNNPRVLRFEPPLTVSEEQIEKALAAFEDGLIETQALLALLV